MIRTRSAFDLPATTRHHLQEAQRVLNGQLHCLIEYANQTAALYQLCADNDDAMMLCEEFLDHLKQIGKMTDQAFTELHHILPTGTDQ